MNIILSFWNFILKTRSVMVVRIVGIVVFVSLIIEYHNPTTYLIRILFWVRKKNHNRNISQVNFKEDKICVGFTLIFMEQREGRIYPCPRVSSDTLLKN